MNNSLSIVGTVGGLFSCKKIDESIVQCPHLNSYQELNNTLCYMHLTNERDRKVSLFFYTKNKLMEELLMTTFDKYTFKQLLATTLREKEDGYVFNEIFNRYPSIQELLEITEEELLQIKGIGKVKAQQIIAALKLTRMLPTTAEEKTIHILHNLYEKCV